MTRKEKKKKKKQEYTAISHFTRTKNYNQKLQASINFRFCTNYIEAVDATDESSSVPLTAWRVFRR